MSLDLFHVFSPGEQQVGQKKPSVSGEAKLHVASHKDIPWLRGPEGGLRFRRAWGQRRRDPDVPEILTGGVSTGAGEDDSKTVLKKTNSCNLSSDEEKKPFGNWKELPK